MTTQAKIRKRQTYDWVLRTERAERAAQDRQATPTPEPVSFTAEADTETEADTEYVFTPPEKVELDELDPDDVQVSADGVAFRCQFEQPSSWGNRTIWFRVPPEMVVPVMKELRQFAISQRQKAEAK